MLNREGERRNRRDKGGRERAATGKKRRREGDAPALLGVAAPSRPCRTLEGNPAVKPRHRRTRPTAPPRSALSCVAIVPCVTAVHTVSFAEGKPWPSRNPSTPSLKLEHCCNHRVLSSSDPPLLESRTEVARKGNCRGAAVAAALLGLPSFCPRSSCVVGAPRRHCWRQKPPSKPVSVGYTVTTSFSAAVQAATRRIHHSLLCSCLRISTALFQFQSNSAISEYD
ncbi:uncharacterized protein [Arachis hypogaea]|uniref:uncharacterized protein n=1 Tax=Arachis hypogaea TaxID=3818 RepID=UPI0011057129|nr:uncharacterized protein LOC114925230 [Arachis hypogaea]